MEVCHHMIGAAGVDKVVIEGADVPYRPPNVLGGGQFLVV